MPRTRALWSGSLSFGLVNIPVALVPATRDRGVRLRELDSRTGSPVRVRRVCTAEDVEVPFEEIAHGLEVDGKMVMLSDDDLASAHPRRTDTIEISGFVDPAQIDPVSCSRFYWAAPSGRGEGPLRAYRLLVQALAKAQRAAIGAAVIHDREHPVVVRAREERLLLGTLLFADEIRDTADLEIPAARPDPDAVKRMVAVIQELSADFEPARHRDRHRERLRAVIAGKARGETIEPPRAPKTLAATSDLIGALERSIAQARPHGGRRRQRPARRRQRSV